MVKLVDTPDLKSCDRLVVWVRFPLTPPNAGLAQKVERFTCNENVVGSIPTTGSKLSGVAQLAERLTVNQNVVGSSPTTGANCSGGYQSGQMGWTVNPLAYAFAGSSPAPPTTSRRVD